jgi:hypothetical protein
VILIWIAALAQFDVQVRRAGQGEFQMTVATERGAFRDRTLAQFLVMRERFSSQVEAPTGIRSGLEEVERAQVLVQAGRGQASVRLVRPGVYQVEMVVEPEHQLDSKVRVEAKRERRKVVVGDGADWAEAVVGSHRRLARLFEETRKILDAGVTERTPERLEALLGRMEREGPAVMAAGTFDLLYELVKDMVSALAYPDSIIRELPRPGRRPSGIKEPQDSLSVYNPVLRTREQNARCNEAICAERKAALEAIRRFGLKEAELLLLTRAALGEEEVEKLAVAEQALAEADPEFKYDVLRRGKPDDRAALLESLQRP